MSREDRCQVKSEVKNSQERSSDETLRQALRSLTVPVTPREELQRRVAALRNALGRAKLDAALIVQRADLFYFAGTGQDAHLLVPTEGEPCLMVRKSIERATVDSTLERILEIKNLSELKQIIRSVSGGHLRSIGMELDVLPVNNYRQYQRLFPEVEIRDASPLIREIRIIKSPYELDLIREAARINDAMFGYVRSVLRAGMTEMEFSGLIEAFVRARGHQGICRTRAFNQEIFYGHIMSGISLAIPTCSLGPTGGVGPNPSYPQGAGMKVIGRNEPIQVDYLCVKNGYMVDQARTFFLEEVPKQFRKIHEIALRIQNTVAARGMPGMRADQLHQIAVRMADEAGLGSGFMGYPDSVPFVGHGIGIEVDELPVLGKNSPHVLREGMVVALEPKFVIPWEGVAGIENTFVVTPTGLEKLTLFDDEIQVIE